MMKPLVVYTGPTFGRIDLCQPHTFAGSITVSWLAERLANTLRWLNFHPYKISVARHSLFTARLVELLYPEGGAAKSLKHLALATLLHDAHEAFTGDIIAPIKARIPGIKDIEEGINRAICHALGLESPYYPLLMDSYMVHVADAAAYNYEQMLLGVPIGQGRPVPVDVPASLYRQVSKEIPLDVQYEPLSDEAFFTARLGAMLHDVGALD